MELTRRDALTAVGLTASLRANCSAATRRRPRSRCRRDCRSASRPRSGSPNRSATGATADAAARLLQGRRRPRPDRRRPAHRGAVDHRQERLRPELLDGLLGAGGINEASTTPSSTRADHRDEDRDAEAEGGRLPERDLLLRQARRHVGQRRDQELDRLPQADQADRRGQRRHRHRRAAQQQGEPHGLHRRQHAVRRGHRARASIRRTSSCSTTSTTCRSWRATSSRRSASTRTRSATTTPAASPAATSSTRRRS